MKKHFTITVIIYLTVKFLGTGPFLGTDPFLETASFLDTGSFLGAGPFTEKSRKFLSHQKVVKSYFTCYNLCCMT